MNHAADDILLMAAALHVSGISPSERLVLIAYADHADKRGYCWPSVDRLAEITGLSRATVTRANKRLRTLGLIVSIRRVNPRTGEPISNLTRLNIARMRAMRRRPAEPYADLIQEITLPEDGTDDSADGDTDDATETGSDQLIHHGEPYLGLTVSHTPSHHEPLTSQRNPQKNSSSSPLTDARQSQPSHDQEEEEKINKGKTHTPVADLGVEAAIRHIVDRNIGIDRDGARVIVDSITASMLKRGETVSFWDRYIRRFTDEQLHQRLTDAARARVRGRIITHLPGCGECNPLRRLEDAEGNDLGPCPTCNPKHPNYQPAATTPADTPAERIAQ